MTTDLNPIFERLEDWLAAHAPQIYAQLTVGASEAELDDLETLIGQRLPADYRALYRRHGDWGRALRLPHCTLDTVRREWLVWQELEPEFGDKMGKHTSHPPGAITPRYINLGWIPFLQDWGGNSVGVDLAPDVAGKWGQVITFGRDENEKVVLADSLGDFLREYLARLEAGRVKVIDETDPDFPPHQRLELTDETGEGVDAYRWLADLFPEFRASPQRSEHTV